MHNDRHMSFFIDPTNETEIINVINHLKEGAPGRDEIVARNLKCISDSIAYPLAQVANLSFQQGIFPEELKIAAVTPLYKAKDPMMFNNYRPISLISVFAKILERLMYNRLLKFINKNQIFNKHQFGFRDKHSTFMALIILIENLVNAIDNGKCAVGIFLDFQKAFDTVDHCILLDIYFYGIRGQAVDWFSSYLHNRQQLVNYYGCESDLKLLNVEFPKGLFLDPYFSYCSGSLEPEYSCHDRDWIMELPMEADILTFTGILTPEDASVASCFPFDITISLSWFPLLSIPPLHSALP